MLVSAISGGFGSAVAKTFTYPIESSKTRLMNKPFGQTTEECLRELWRNGLYIGFREKVTKSFIQKFIYFYIYEGLLSASLVLVNKHRRKRGLKLAAKPSTLLLLGSGYLGEALGIPIFAPLEYIAVQVQTSTTREGPLSIVRRTLREKGVAGFYRGWEVYLLCAFQPMIQFTLIERTKEFLLRGQDRRAVLSAAAAFWLGALTKAVASSITYPINLGRVKIQGEAEASNLDVNQKVRKPSLFTVLRGVLEKEGPAGLYKGLPNEVAEGLLGAAILLMIKERCTGVVRMAIHTAFRVDGRISRA